MASFIFGIICDFSNLEHLSNLHKKLNNEEVERWFADGGGIADCISPGKKQKPV
jgi:DNA-binding MltR family transcriptional regulator